MQGGWFLVATVDIPELRIRAGELVRYNPRGPGYHWTIARREDLDFGAVLQAYNTGALEALDIMPAGVLEASPPPPDAPPHPAQDPSPRHLRVLG